MSNDLVTPAMLSHLPGAPFTNGEVDIAVATVQRALGWHVAPTLTQTVEILTQAYMPKLRLPTKALVSVSSVKINGTVVSPSDYEVIRSRNYVLRNNYEYWDVGTAEVTFRHGYDETPQDLLPLIAEAAAIDRRDESVKPYRLSFEPYEGFIPAKYSILLRPGMA